MHIHANKKNFINKTNKIIFISTHLHRIVWNWFEPYIREYYKVILDNQSNTIKELFIDSGNLYKHFKQTFGNIDAEAVVEYKLKQLY